MKVHDVVSLEPYEKEELPPLKELLGDFAPRDVEAIISRWQRCRSYFTQESGQVATSRDFHSLLLSNTAARHFGTVSYVLGAPEFVLRDDYETYKETIESYGSEGYRVLVFGRYEGTSGRKGTDRISDCRMDYVIACQSDP